MKLKIFYSLSIAFLATSLFWSCQDEPAFPDPGFELEVQKVEVRRDTIDVYTVKMNMEVPNGVNFIEVLNATNYDLIATIDAYSGKQNFEFNYNIDLTSLETDTVLYFIFKVTDNDRRTTNRGFALTVKGFSFPELQLVGGTSLNVVVPVYELKGLVTTGLNELESIQIKFKGEEQYLYTVPEDTAIFEYILTQQVGFGTLSSGQEYIMDVVIKDRKGQTSTTEIKVRKGEGLKRPVKITQLNYAGVYSYLELFYDEHNRVNKIYYWWPSGANRTYYLSYNELGVVDTLSLELGGDGTSLTSRNQLFIYKEGTTQLDRVLRYDYNVSENGSVEIEVDHEIESQDFQYDENGVLQSFYGEASTIKMEYADPFGTGEAVFMDYWQNSDYFEILDKNRQYRTGFQPIYMPSYIEGLPPFNTLYSIDRQLFNKVFYNKYVFTGTEAVGLEYDGSYLEEPGFTYETDADGNVTLFVESYLWNGWQQRSNVFTFEY